MKRPEKGAAVLAVVTVTHSAGRESRDTETRVRTLQELFDACRAAPVSRLVRVSILGPEGEVQLNFANFRRGS